MGFGSGFVLSKLRWQTFFEARPYLHLTDAGKKSALIIFKISLRSCGCVVVKGYQLPGAFVHDQCGFELIIHTLVEFSKMVTEPKNHG